MANRYSQITTSKFNPLSFEQIAAPAMMKREQHNKALADQETMLKGLNAIKPGEKFYSEAQRLKGDITSQVNTFGESLAKEGVNSNTQAGMIALNRQYQEAMGPTGKLGMIHENNIATQKAYDDAVASSMKMGNSETIAKQNVDENFKKYNTEVPMYNEKTGQVIGFNAGSAPKFVDPIAFTDELASKAKMSSAEWKSAMAGIKMDGAGNQFVVDTSRAGAKGSNLEALQSVASLLNQTMNDPSSELVQSLQYNKKDLNAVRNQMATQLGIYKQTTSNTESSQGMSNVKWFDPAEAAAAKAKADKTTGAGVTQETVVVDSTKDYEFDITRIGQKGMSANVVGSPALMGVGGGGGLYSNAEGSKWTYKDIRNPIAKNQYVNIWNAYRTKGIFPEGSRVNDPRVAAIIAKKMKENGPITLSTKVMVPNVTPNELMFSGSQTTGDINARSNPIARNLQAGRQRMQDPLDPTKVLSPEEFRERGYKITYDSYVSPMNFVHNPFGNSAQGAVPHQVLVYDKEGKSLGTTLVDRTSEDIRSPAGRASQTLHSVYDMSVKSPNVEHTINNPHLAARGIKNLKVEYQTMKDGKKLAEPIMNVRVGSGKIISLTTDEFNEQIYNNFTKQ